MCVGPCISTPSHIWETRFIGMAYHFGSYDCVSIFPIWRYYYQHLKYNTYVPGPSSSPVATRQITYIVFSMFPGLLIAFNEIKQS